jgi:Na+/melibiose symporter-like transporter
VFAAVPARARGEGVARRVDWLGAGLCALGLAGPVFALIRQPAVGWGSPDVLIPLVAGVLMFAAFLVWERRAPNPMLPLGLFRRRNFAIGNLETFGMYGGLSIVFFFLVLFLQQVAGYSALEAGLATLPVTLVMFALSRRAGALADRFGPRPFMGFGPLISAAGIALMLRLDADVDYLTDVLPAVLVFALGLATTVAPLTATVLADADERNAGIASGVNNAIARVAGLMGVAAMGAVLAASFSSTVDRELAGRELSPASQRAVAEAKARTLIAIDPSGLPPDEGPEVAEAVETASVRTFHIGMGLAASLVAAAGIIGLAGIRDPRRQVAACDCPGGQFAGQPVEAGRVERVPAAEPAG